MDATALFNRLQLLVRGRRRTGENPILGIQAEAKRTFLTYAARYRAFC